MHWKIKKLTRKDIPKWAKSIIVHSNSIDGCPVRDYSGVAFCANTPYEDFADDDNISGDVDEAVHQPQFLGYAKVELEFLKSLLPKPETQND